VSRLPHPKKNDGRTAHPLYSAWNAMRKRCFGKQTRAYPRYGGRGIKIAPEWDNFWTFVSDMGPRPAGSSLDRINNDGNYEPGNCRWATPKQQSNNKRHWKTRLIAFDGRVMNVAGWSAHFRIHHSALSHRIRRHGVAKAMAMGAVK
jgi:hypothetical protein